MPPLPRFLLCLSTSLAALAAAFAPGVLVAAEPPRVLFMISEEEYDTRTTVPAFAKAELEPAGIECTFSIAPRERPNEFPGLEALKTADLLFISVKRQALNDQQMALVRAHVAAGKAVAGIRTASHAFAPPLGKTPRPAPARQAYWPEWDHEVLGGNYQNHYGVGVATFVKPLPQALGHPVLAGVGEAEFPVRSHLYKNPGLPESDTILMTGRMSDRPEVEPVAWVNTAHGGRVFYTSLGSPGDFEIPQFRRLLRNGILWTLNRPTADSPPVSAPDHDQSPVPRPATKSPASATTPALSPAEAAKSFTVAPGLRFTQVLAEPEVTQPVFLNFDERGRMWVVEYRQYPSPAGLTMLSHDSYWRAVYDQVPAAPPHQVRGLDRITIHESTKGDGVFDRHSVFLDGLNICTAVERGRGGVWVLNPPYLLFYPMHDGDDKPAGDPVVHLAGFGIQDTHSVANSLRWGPDGWLYGAHGSTVVSTIVRPGLDKEPVAHMTGQGIWRYQPETHRFEIFAEGGGNTFGVEIDAKGRIFSGHNGANTRGFHYLQGAYLRKGFDKHGPLSNPYTFGFFDAMPHEKAERYSHNFLIYAGAALPQEYRGKLLGCEPMQGRIVESELTPEGASFKTHDLQRPVTSSDRWFRPVDIKLGPDGAVYVCDWYDRQINHYRNHEGQIDTSNGRVYRLEAAETKQPAMFDLGKLSSQALVDELDNQNKWFRQTALRVLGDRRDPALWPALKAKLTESDGQTALESLWALHLTGGLDEATALETLAHRDPFVRLWTARLVCDEETVSPVLAAALAELAAREPEIEVRAQLACSARRLAAGPDLAIVRALLAHDEDAADRRQPLLLWWAVEAKAETDFPEILTLLHDPSLWTRPLVRDGLLARLMRRYAQAGSRQDLLRCTALLEAAPAREGAKRLMLGFDEAVKGHPPGLLPPELLAAMARHGLGSADLALRQGDPAAVTEALRVLQDKNAPSSRRLEICAIFADVKIPQAVPVLLEVFEKSPKAPLRQAALHALATSDDMAIADRIIASFPGLNADLLNAAQLLLTSRLAWSSRLVAAVESGAIAPTAVPAPVVQRLRQVSDRDLSLRVEKLWGSEKKPSTAEMNQQIERLAGVLAGGSGDVRQGRELFRSLCAGCHTLHNEGGHVGPDLTGYNRGDLPNLLLNIINPSAEIREGYENVFVTTRDGRTVNGFLAEQDARTVVLRGLDGQNVTLAREEVAELKSSGVSLMPEGLLTSLTDPEVRALFAYLRSAQPLPEK